MIKINLLPVREERRKAGLRQLGLSMVVALIGAVALAASIQWKLQGDLASAQAQVAQTKREIDRFGPQLKQVEQYKKTKEEIERKLSVIEQLDDSRSGPVHVLDELARRTPDRLWLTDLSAKNHELDIQGLSLDNELVALFLTDLNASPYFKDVELLGTQAKDVNGFKLNQFKLKAQITSPAAEKHAQDKASSASATVGTLATRE
jgi:type IV pilus assembly protein PilN